MKILLNHAIYWGTERYLARGFGFHPLLFGRSEQLNEPSRYAASVERIRPWRLGDGRPVLTEVRPALHMMLARRQYFLGRSSKQIYGADQRGRALMAELRTTEDTIDAAMSSLTVRARFSSAMDTVFCLGAAILNVTSWVPMLTESTMCLSNNQF